MINTVPNINSYLVRANFSFMFEIDSYNFVTGKINV